MKVLYQASAGTEGKEDVKVLISPAEKGIDIVVRSTVGALFGRQIEAAAKALLARFEINSCTVEIDDHSALDYVLRARMETAICRAVGEGI